MSVVEPEIDKLLDMCEDDKYLLCTVASKRARDINDMMRGQRQRALELQSVDELVEIAKHKPLSLALNEICRGEVSFDPATFADNGY